MEMSDPYLRCFWFQRVWDFGLLMYIIHSEVCCGGDPSENTEFYNVPYGLLDPAFSITLYTKHSHIMELSRFINFGMFSIWRLEMCDLYRNLGFLYISSENNTDTV